MSRHGFTDLSASLRSGGDLTPIIEAIQSGHIGTGRPDYAVPGMVWADQIDADTIKLMLHVGGSPAADVEIGTADLVAGKFSTAAGGSDYQQFDASGTWTRPQGFPDDAFVLVEMWGGGARGYNTGGGGGGAFSCYRCRLSDLNSVETVTVGAGGGNNGGTSSITNIPVTAGGGNRDGDGGIGMFRGGEGGREVKGLPGGADAGAAGHYLSTAIEALGRGGDGGAVGQPGQVPGGGGGDGASGADGRVIIWVWG